MYMSTASKIRKQVYIDLRQDRWLKQRSRKTGIPEAEIVRRALDREIRETEANKKRAEVWKEARALIQESTDKGPVSGGRSWRREDLYDRKCLA
jgi:hypothetical protein